MRKFDRKGKERLRMNALLEEEFLPLFFRFCVLSHAELYAFRICSPHQFWQCREGGELTSLTLQPV